MQSVFMKIIREKNLRSNPNIKFIATKENQTRDGASHEFILISQALVTFSQGLSPQLQIPSLV